MTVKSQSDAQVRAELVDEVIDRMPDWVTALTRLNDAVADRMGVGATDLHCLHALNRRGPSTAGELSEQLGRITGAITHMINRLEAVGYVRRISDPTDRRRVVVEASEAGLAKAAAGYIGLDARSRETLGDFTTEQLRAITQFVRGGINDAAAEIQQISTSIPAG
ncbi:MarR family transcriptional regulator [Rhodococcus sp. H29-C3]|uniref:MarR family winged helix-turn-helix transcriptional regulator n=1 Tax=Rhodococcus sp. H29-C3 TaxID=3046307 RepID=UPI0024BA724A|nr:MarR family transcriptional regulator [Rhodococcus sp. H29-C3]MDJ0363183.1 MarR family transcriptional regulator [Rhodococcus sp. H29-C3]